MRKVRRKGKAVLYLWVPLALLVALTGAMFVVALGDYALNKPASIEDAELLPIAIYAAPVALIVAATFAALAWRSRNGQQSVLVGFAVGCGLVAGAVLVILMFAVYVLVLGWLDRDDEPQSMFWATVTLALGSLLAVAAVVASVTLALRWLAGDRIDHPYFAIFGWATVFGLLIWFVGDPPEAANPGADRPPLAGNTAGRFDILLVVDPAEPAGRRLVRLAAERPEALKAPRGDAVRWDTSYGIAVLGAGDRSLRIARHPASGPDRARVTTELARLTDDDAPVSPAGRAAALRDLADPNRVRWRDGSERRIALIAADTDAERDAIGALGAFRAGGDGSPATRVDLVADRASGRGLDAWRRAVQATGGTVELPWRPGGEPDERDALARAEDAATGATLARWEAETAFKHRPRLEFDADDRRRPLDVDAFLEERGDDGEPAHQVCAGGAVLTPCEDIASARDLMRDIGDRARHISFDHNAKTGLRDADRPQRMYFNVAGKRGDERVHLDYWIFYRFNDAPRFPRHTCLAGFSVKDVTCFDHQGDWEGVTVTLRRASSDGGYAPESVAYAGHHWPSYRFSWRRLSDVGATRGDRPRVWVADGSHASYPAPCGRAFRNVSCRQPDSSVPDGDRDGGGSWPPNADAACRPSTKCLLALPEAPGADRPATWAAFGGRWGVPRCIFGTKLCEAAAGPDSPWNQKRFANPGGQPVRDDLLGQWYGRGGASPAR